MIGFRSTAQHQKFKDLVKQGKMDIKTYQNWVDNTPKHIELPDRLHPSKHPGNSQITNNLSVSNKFDLDHYINVGD